MTLPVIVLRPEPGASATAQRLAGAGANAILFPLFTIEPLDWALPRLDGIDGLLLTSANAVRHAGPQLDSLSHLPVWCVGAATAGAARTAGLTIVGTGNGGVDDVLPSVPPTTRRLLWLAGQDRTAVHVPDGLTLEVAAVYRAAPTPDAQWPEIGACVVLVHSVRAGQAMAALPIERDRVHLVVISDAVAAVCGTGWRSIAVAPAPRDAQMVAIAAKLCHD